jgi:hypothetical protein
MKEEAKLVLRLVMEYEEEAKNELEFVPLDQ